MSDLNISVSRMQAMAYCPRKHHYQYELNLAPKQEAEALTVGTAVHAGVEAYYSGQAWMHKLGGVAGEKVDAALGAYLPFALLNDHGLTIDGLEVDFSLPVELTPIDVQPWGLRFNFVGRRDGEVRLDDRLYVFEHKTASRPWSSQKMDMDLQHNLYELALEEERGEKVHGTVFNFMVFNTRQGRITANASRRIIAANPTARVAAYEEMEQLAQQIKAGARHRNVGSGCAYCEFASICTAQFQGGDAEWLIANDFKQRKPDQEESE